MTSGHTRPLTTRTKEVRLSPIPSYKYVTNIKSLSKRSKPLRSLIIGVGQKYSLVSDMPAYRELGQVFLERLAWTDMSVPLLPDGLFVPVCARKKAWD